jgi:hypothetical protein
MTRYPGSWRISQAVRPDISGGLAGTITYTTTAITVTLGNPDAPNMTRALQLLLDEINATPPTMPGDTRPITHQLARQPAFNSLRTAISGDLGPAERCS